MRCHCFFELSLYNSHHNSDPKTYECKYGHMSVCYKDNVVTKYTIIWDEDIRARNRYKLTYNDNRTVLSKQDKTNNSYYSSPYSIILVVDRKIDLIVEQDVVQASRMIEGLNKLKAFA